MASRQTEDIARLVLDVGERIEGQSSDDLDLLIADLLIRSGATNCGDPQRALADPDNDVLTLNTATCLALAWLHTRTWET